MENGESYPHRQAPLTRRALKKLDINYGALAEEVTELYVTKGYTRAQVITTLKKKYKNLPHGAVHNIINRHSLHSVIDNQIEEARESIIKDKLPLIQGVIGVNLHTILEFSCNLARDEKRKSELTVKDAKDLTSLISDLNTLIRLENGQSTSNHSITLFQGSQEELLKTARDIIELDPVYSEDDDEPEANT